MGRHQSPSLLTVFPLSHLATTPGVNGSIYATSYKAPTPANMQQAMNDMNNAYAYASQESPPTSSNAAAGSLDGLTITPGIYQYVFQTKFR